MAKHKSKKGRYGKKHKGKKKFVMTAARKAALKRLHKKNKGKKHGKHKGRHHGPAPYGSGMGVIGHKRHSAKRKGKKGKRKGKRGGQKLGYTKCTRCPRIIFGGAKGLATHNRRHHR